MVSGTVIGQGTALDPALLSGHAMVLPWENGFMLYYTAQYSTGFAVYAAEIGVAGSIIATNVVSPLLYNGSGFEFRYDVCSSNGKLVLAVATPLSGPNFGITLSTLKDGPEVDVSISFTGTTVDTSEIKSLSVHAYIDGSIPFAGTPTVMVGWSDNITLYGSSFRVADLAEIGSGTTAWNNVQYITG